MPGRAAKTERDQERDHERRTGRGSPAVRRTSPRDRRRPGTARGGFRRAPLGGRRAGGVGGASSKARTRGRRNSPAGGRGARHIRHAPPRTGPRAESTANAGRASAANAPHPNVRTSRPRRRSSTDVIGPSRAVARTIAPASQPLYLMSWARPTASPSTRPRTGPGRSRKRPPAARATSHASRNVTSVSAIRLRVTCGIDTAAKAAAATPTPGPNVRRPSQATTGIVAIPARIETAIAVRSDGPRSSGS